MDRIQDPERARRLARTIASDLSAYRDHEFMSGATLDARIEEGRAYFKRRVITEVYELDLYDEAIEQVLRPEDGQS